MAKYTSALRAEQAAATRRRVIAAAGECFAESGYPATTLRAIATRAGVSVETVQAAGAKRALLMAAFDQIYTGENDERHFAERPGVAELLADPDPERALRSLARWIADGNRRVSGLWSIIVAAATSDPDIASYHAEHVRRMREQTADVVADLVARHLIEPARPVDRTADLIWQAQLPEVWRRLVSDAGWSHEEYAEWLADTAVALCVPRKRRRPA